MSEDYFKNMSKSLGLRIGLRLFACADIIKAYRYSATVTRQAILGSHGAIYGDRMISRALETLEKAGYIKTASRGVFTMTIPQPA